MTVEPGSDCIGCRLKAEVVRLLVRIDEVMMAPAQTAAQDVADAIWSGASDSRIAALEKAFAARKGEWHRERDRILHRDVLAMIATCVCPAGSLESARWPSPPSVEVPDVTAQPRGYGAAGTIGLAPNVEAPVPTGCLRCGREIEAVLRINDVGVCSRCFGRSL